MDPNAIIQAFRTYLIDPEDASTRFTTAMGDNDAPYQFHAQVAGSPDYPLGIAVAHHKLEIIGEKASLEHSPFVDELHNKGLPLEKQLNVFGSQLDVLTAPIDVWLQDRLAVPKITLVNLFHPDMYPA